MTAEEIAEFFSETETYRILEQRTRSVALAEGRVKGLAEGVLALLRVRFGDLPGLAELAEELAVAGPPDVVYAAVHAAETPDSILPGLKG